MQLIDGRLVFSATDLVAYLDCPHRLGLELARARGDLERPERDSNDADLAAKHGLAHEASHLGELKARGLEVVEIVGPTRQSIEELTRAAGETTRAMQEGADVIFQGTLFDGTWLGYADFLVRVDRPSGFGLWSYEAHDTKLARHTKVGALLQLAQYSLQLQQLQGLPPTSMAVVLGDCSVDLVPVKDTAPYVRRLQQRFLIAVHSDLVTHYPMPIEHCAICAWAPRCEQRRLDDDHLSGLPGVGCAQVAKLEEADVSTIAALGSAPEPPGVAGMAPQALANLHTLAVLQVASRHDGRPLYRPKPPGETATPTGLAMIPTPDPADLFFDLEGDPYLSDTGREYLWGWCDTTGNAGYQCLWGHTPASEQAAVQQFIDLVTARLDAHPGMHVYHYAAYEMSALKRLTAAHGTREIELDHLLRSGVFVDLYAATRPGLWVSTPSYSIKDLERFYRPARETTVQSGMASVVAYEDWLETRDATLLDDIAAYNRDDCVSTLELRDWLLSIRPDPPEPAAPEPETDGPEGPTDRQLREARRTALVERLTAGLHDDRTQDQHSTWLLAHLLGFHQREARPAFWWLYARMAMTNDELREDGESIAPLDYLGPTGSVRRSTIHRYTFDPSQDFKLGLSDRAIDPDTGKSVGAICGLNVNEGWLELTRARDEPPHQPRGLVPDVGPSTDSIEDALLELATWVAENGVSSPGPFSAARELLTGATPRIRGMSPGVPLVGSDEDPGRAAVQLALNLDGSCLAVQGPPGSGKTYTGAALIGALIADDKKVGVIANSHEVVHNLLNELVEQGVPGDRVLKVGGGLDPETCPFRVAKRNTAKVREDILDPDGPDVVGGTAWLFSNADLREAFDVLVMDEAGQLSLATALAASTSARNLVLLGDPQQLDQPMQGAHPEGTATSALGHLLGPDETIRPESGVFLDHTWRMHPDVCESVSQLSYGGRLESHPRCTIQTLIRQGTGIRFEPVDHEGCSRSSVEEAARISELVARLLDDEWVDHEGTQRPLDCDDILVIAPYNAQVRLLQQTLGGRVQVGTVDKFQGQEAAVAIYSLTASSGEDVPRNMAFQFSRNRLNVAISRAKCLSILVGSERLLDAKPNSREQLALLSGLCGLVESAGPMTE